MYPGGKNTKTLIFNCFPCSYLGEENVISHNKEQKADVSLSVQIPLPPQLLFSCLQLQVLLLQSTHYWYWSLFVLISSLDPLAVCTRRKTFR